MKPNKYILIGLVVVLSFALYTVFFSGGKKKMESMAASLEPPKIIAQPAEVRAKEARVQAVQETVQWERDPFTLPSFLMTREEEG